jgi:hypothetical protein
LIAAQGGPIGDAFHARSLLPKLEPQRGLSPRQGLDFF